jgi:RNA polymerase sigma-70 factor (ECF subfamily)
VSRDEALLAVFEGERGRLRGFFIRGTRPESLADDLVQETLLRAWGHRDAFVGPSGAEGLDQGSRQYLWRVARNLLIDHLRWRRRQRAREVEGEATAAPEGPGMEEAVEREACHRILHETVDTLGSVRVRHCLTLWLEGRDHSAIARQLDLGAGQVRGLLQRGRAELVRRAGPRLREARAG